MSTLVAAKKPLPGLVRKLVELELLQEKQAEEVLLQALKLKVTPISLLVEENMVEGPIVAEIAMREFGLPLLDLDNIDKEVLPKNLIPEKMVRQNHAIPIYRRGNKLFVAVSDPTNLQALDEIKFQTGVATEAILVESNKLSSFIEQIFNDTENTPQQLTDIADEDLDSLDIQSGEEIVEDKEDKQEVDDAPIVRFINKVLLDAINKGASDIHFEPYEKYYRVRFRTDGILKEVANPPVSLAPRLSARLKVMSRLDISERRIPQDGRFKMRISKNRAIDFRVSTCPTLFGEKVVLRILDPASAKVGVEALGLLEFQRDLLFDAINKPQGMILVTGPTGSGKTVTLYSALNILNTLERNISTAEDPVEINLPGINQVSMNPKAGLNFAEALRAFLRQDPDVVMVGEIRDLETAETAVKAAQTGHMVLSTLHTNSAADTLNRLINMGVAPFNLATALTLVIAQRLARKLCEYCKKELQVPESALLQSGVKQADVASFHAFGPVGCERCSDGYKGRLGLFEMMPVTEAIGNIIMTSGSAIDILATAKKDGFVTLREAGLIAVNSGRTSLAEVLRVTKD